MANNYGFRVIEDTDLEAFEKEVKRLLEDGWELHGNLISFPDEKESGVVKAVRYIQAMKKDLTERQRGGFRIGQSID